MSKIKKQQDQNKQKGRPIENIIKGINDTPQNIAKTIMVSAPKNKWDYRNTNK